MLRPREGGLTVPITFVANGAYDGIARAASDLAAVDESARGASAACAAPWLLDPLHVRTFFRDGDRTERWVPRTLLRARADSPEPAASGR